jgi:BlaR1 peptidase M56
LLDPVLRHTLRSGQTRRKIDVCVSEAVRVPTAIGLSNPAIVFPDWALRELSPTELNQILLHEMAHLRRWDDWTNLAQQIVKALLFFHPAVWWIENQASLEREIACDDAVLEQTKSPRAYAECLAHLAERTFVQRSVALAQALLGRFRQTSTRVAQILASDRPKGDQRGWKPAVGLVASFAVICGVVAARAPRLISFSDSRSNAFSVSTATGTPEIFVTPPQEFPRVAPVTQARLTSKAVRSKAAIRAREVLRPASGRQHASGPALRMASLKSELDPYNATVFVLIQAVDRTSAQHMYQIQMWRLTLLRFVVEPASDSVPAKKT